MLPSAMTTNSDCNSLAWTCLKLGNLCSEKLSNAIGKCKKCKKKANKCKKALKRDAKKLVETFCPVTCKKCSKFRIEYGGIVSEQFNYDSSIVFKYLM